MAVAQLPKTGLKTQTQSDRNWRVAMEEGYAALEARTGLSYAGDPNGNVIGSWLGQLCRDTDNDILYSCTTIGDAATAVWEAIPSLAANLSDLPSASTARGNLGLGNVATRNTGTTDGAIPLIGATNKISESILPNGYLPVGAIVLWYGTAAGVPTGWSICNGTNGTPDLRNRIIVGADSNGPNATGWGGSIGGSGPGSVAPHTLSLSEMPNHSHGYYRSFSGGTVDSGFFLAKGELFQQSEAVGGGAAHSHTYTPPAWRAMYYIMRTE